MLGATFLFVPWLGSENSLKAVVIAFAVMAMYFLFQETSHALSARLVAAGVIALPAVLAVPIHWDWAHLTSGAPMYFGEYDGKRGDASVPMKRSVIFQDEHIQGGFTTVVDVTPVDQSRGTSVRSVYSNGKLQGNDDLHGEFGLNFGIAFVPAMFAGGFDNALLIGLGSGQSAWLLKQAGFQQVDIAEFSPGIVRAASSYFTHINHDVLADPTVRVILEDGRNLLLVESGRKYGLITVELSTIWFSGATNLYSREFYELARKRLTSDGILQQWVQLHRIGPDAIGSALATARAVFPYVAYWSYGGQGMIVAGNHPLVMNPERKAWLAERLGKSPDLPPGRASEILDEITARRIARHRRCRRPGGTAQAGGQYRSQSLHRVRHAALLILRARLAGLQYCFFSVLESLIGYFCSITSVDLMTTVTVSPFLRPISSTLLRVITLSIVFFPILTTT